MGLIDKFKKGGTGFMHNVDGLIKDVVFTDTPEFGSGERQEKDGGFRSLWAKLTVRQDGAEEDQTTHLFAGNADSFVISEDGHEITPVEAGKIDLFGAFRRFYASGVQNGIEDISDEVIASGGPLNFSNLIGARVRFQQVKDEDAMKRSAKNYRKSGGKINELGQRKGKDGKFYDQRTPEIVQVYSVGNSVDVAPPSTPPPAVTTAPAKKTPTKGNGKVTGNTGIDAALQTFAQETLVNILSATASGSLPKNGINLAVTRALTGDLRRDPVRKYLFEDVNLEQMQAQGIIKYDKSSKDQTISLA